PRSGGGDRAGSHEPPIARAHDPPAQPRRGPRPRQPRARAGAVRAARRHAVRGAFGGVGGGPRPAPTPPALMRLGTRRSALALAQAKLVADLLGGDCEIVPIATSGDRGLEHEDKSRWVRELEDALSSGKIDLAVHSAKDVPGELAEGLSLLGAPPRAAVEDVLCGADGLDGLAPGAQVGT